MSRALPVALSLAALWSATAIAPALADGPRARGAAWCDSEPSAGEPVPPPRPNLPEWACTRSSQLGLHATYAVRTSLNPFYLAGDFDGDGRQGLAI